MKFLTAFIFIFFTFSLQLNAAPFENQLKEAGELLNQAVSTSGESNNQKLIEQAAEIYEQCFDSGAHFGGLHYNLGNCYFLLGQFEKSILNYRRALKIIPNDSRVTNNLKVARQQISQLFEATAEDRALSALLFFHDFNWPQKIFIFNIILFLFLTSLLIQIKWKHLSFKYFSFISLFITIALAVSLISHNERSGGVVMNLETYAYQGNGYNFDKTFDNALSPGTEFDLIEIRNNWLKVKFADSSEAWLHRDTIALDQN